MANLIEDEDDHFYGAWIGGSKAKGGHPEGEAPKGPTELGDPRETCTEDELAAVRSWQATFEDVDYIQGHPKSAKARDFAAAVAKCPPVGGTVYRGIKQEWSPAEFADPKNAGPYMDAPASLAYWTDRVGKEVAFHEPVSTIGDLREAQKYGSVIFAINPQPGAARDISRLSWLPDWHEAILAPGRFRVDMVNALPYAGKDEDITVVHITDITRGERTWLADGKGARP